tara:strand:- start:9416 stop:10300 length:885 start_codon:yes stop_codon:yes gene_type:complete
MNIYICTLVSKKNLKFLRSFLKSLDEIKLPGNLKFKMIFIINPKIRYSKLLIKRYLNRLDYFILESIKDNIPYSRNVFLKFIRKKNYVYAGFLDDDCIVDNNWLVNMINFIKQNNCDIVGGPQKHKIRDITYQNYYDVLEPNREHGKLVKWVATNNCFFSKKILMKSTFFFNTEFAKYGGSDQLFFYKFYKKKFILKWNLTSFIIENYNSDREKKIWFLKRNLRYGYSGNLIDKKIYGKMSLIIIFMKIFYLLIGALFFKTIPTSKSQIRASFFLFRAFGRFKGLFNYRPEKYI